MPVAFPSVPEVTADELRTALDQGEPVHVLDVRPREDFEAWPVPGSRHVGGSEALKEGREDIGDDLSVPDDAPVVTVCGAGKTSREAARQLGGRDHVRLRRLRAVADGGDPSLRDAFVRSVR